MINFRQLVTGRGYSVSLPALLSSLTQGSLFFPCTLPVYLLLLAVCEYTFYRKNHREQRERGEEPHSLPRTPKTRDGDFPSFSLSFSFSLASCKVLTSFWPSCVVRRLQDALLFFASSVVPLGPLGDQGFRLGERREEKRREDTLQDDPCIPLPGNWHREGP